MIITSFTIIELSIACVSIIGAVSLCLKSSRCDSVVMPCVKIHRVVEEIETTEITPPSIHLEEKKDVIH